MSGMERLQRMFAGAGGSHGHAQPDSPTPNTSEQKVIALKKAYTDIIPNTAKEATSRVMVSEKRAVRQRRGASDDVEDQTDL